MQQPTQIELRKIRDIGDVLNDTFRFLRQNYRPLGKSLLYIVGPVMMLSSMAGALIQILSMSLGEDPTEAAMFSMAVWLGVALFLVVVLGVVGASLSIVVVDGFIKLYLERGPVHVEVRDVWGVAKRYFWRVLGSMSLFVLVFLVGFVIVLIPCLGLLAYMAAVVYFGVTFSLFFPILLIEDIGIIEGVRRSLELVKGYWWATLGVLFVAGIIWSILGGLFSIPYYVVYITYIFHAVEGEGVSTLYDLLLVVTSLITGLGTALLYSVPLTASAFQYFNLVEQKERTGLLGRIDALAASGHEGDDASYALPPRRLDDGASNEPNDGASDRA